MTEFIEFLKQLAFFGVFLLVFVIPLGLIGMREMRKEREARYGLLSRSRPVDFDDDRG
jgi:hypothetical protein